MRNKNVMNREIEEKCKELGITPHTYRSRLRRGWTKEEALLAPKIGAVHKINGEPVYQYLKRVGGSYNAFQYRIRAGYDFHDSIVFAQEPRTHKRGTKNVNKM